jgi:hypothetical protein
MLLWTQGAFGNCKGIVMTHSTIQRVTLVPAWLPGNQAHSVRKVVAVFNNSFLADKALLQGVLSPHNPSRLPAQLRLGLFGLLPCSSQVTIIRPARIIKVHIHQGISRVMGHPACDRPVLHRAMTRVHVLIVLPVPLQHPPVEVPRRLQEAMSGQ